MIASSSKKDLMEIRGNNNYIKNIANNKVKIVMSSEDNYTM
jgi:hypothetical protein